MKIMKQLYVENNIYIYRKYAGAAVLIARVVIFIRSKNKRDSVRDEIISDNEPSEYLP
ncbi:hypothetical protein CONCODRAFT_6250 [Conidiobolus coronatus NRRL 28638]|uniref:Uncharacterized protein n=1 Tax=Conidiobolus coronatus (strain ATCC 28846 / CBS 209.66 / NRRL 28638) TaxID=796925 RepID=A0A137P7T7_CONC2|nr:hypothetical protein CONCODRAFT_6250 [Conidiobolus coronatus NRRL 28638]|eukprot:KXN71087.1 hypothetical protein CONCODRAFT_6250 [Conidiobolus coronatus NRRL 28638]